VRILLGSRCRLISALAAKLFRVRDGSTHAPFVDQLDIEPPITADPEGRQFPVLE
jgi:hypothetical protein